VFSYRSVPQIEYLDTKLFTNREHLNKFIERRKYNPIRLDVENQPLILSD